MVMGSGWVLVAPLLFASVAGAGTLTVCPTGCDFSTVNAAIDAAVNGDVIELAAETYAPGAVIDLDGKNLTLRGSVDSNGTPVTFLDGGGAHVMDLSLNGAWAAIHNTVYACFQ